MINTLFSMHNIKYIVSVDDCFFAPRREELEAKIYSEMCASINSFKEYLSSIGKDDLLAEIDDAIALGADTNTLLSNLLEELSDQDLMNMLSVAEKDTPNYSVEQTGITSFLSNLQEQGCIEKYVTLPSTAAAIHMDCSKEGMVNGNILWLLDRNFERVGESPDAGIQLAQTIVQRKGTQTNYVYILSAVEPDQDKDEDSIEAEFDQLLSARCDLTATSFIYYIHKQRLLQNKEKRIAKSFAQGFKRKVCYELFQEYGAYLEKSVEASVKMMLAIRQQTLNFLFAKRVREKGESNKDFITRLVQILQTEEYRKTLAENHENIANKLAYYDELCNAVADTPGNTREITPIIRHLRELELYDKHINAQHSEVSTGDIFCIEESYYILVSQACDTYLRQDGCRKLQLACLLKIEQDSQKLYKYELSCFEELKKPSVIYQSQLSIPFDILDLCVAWENGQAYLDLTFLESGDCPNFIGYTDNYIKRYKMILNRLKKLYECRNIMERYIVKKQDVAHEEARSAYEHLLTEDVFLKKYLVQDNKLTYPVQRICRLNELTTVDILKEYGVILTRIGHPFDFTE